MLIEDTLKCETEARQLVSNSGVVRQPKITFFIVDKVALAIQQAEFLQRTCAGRIGLLYGALGVDNYSQAQWSQVYLENDVVVLTAAILKDCLARGFISIESINLLIYDECHHCQNDHPYALIQYFYHRAKSSDRPRIFGMTASPVGSKKHSEVVIADLEHLLDARVCIPDPRSSLSDFVVKPVESICTYRKPDATHQVGLAYFAEIDRLLSSFKSMRRLLSNARYAGQNLGAWASESILRTLLDDAIWRIDAKAKIQASKRVENEYNTIQQAKCVMQQLSPQTDGQVIGTITPKVSQLLKLLTAAYQDALEQSKVSPKVIVFCERRSTAYLLMKLVNEAMKSLLPKNLQASILIGHGSSEEGDISMQMRRQAAVVDMFRNDTQIKYSEE